MYYLKHVKNDSLMLNITGGDYIVMMEKQNKFFHQIY